MSKLFIEDTTLTAIGNAIRTKEGSTEPIPTTEMAERIANLPSGGGSSDYLIGISPNECKATDEVN